MQITFYGLMARVHEFNGESRRKNISIMKECASLVMYHCWPWFICSVRILISMTRSPLSIGSVIRRPLLVHTCREEFFLLFLLKAFLLVFNVTCLFILLYNKSRYFFKTLFIMCLRTEKDNVGSL
jgi:hypothetical protein